MGDVRIECCVDSIQAAELALDGGADRLEVCSRLSQGGYTPGCELLGAVLKLQKRGYPGCQVFAMVRPWCDGKHDFSYRTRGEQDALSRDLDAVTSMSVHGIVIGALVRGLDGLLDVDRETVGRMCRVAAMRNVPEATFHRAFDDIDADRLASIDMLGRFGFITRILTSGGRGLKSRVVDDGNVEEIVRYQVVASERGISMLPGSGILPENVVGVVRGTGCREVHGSFGGGSLVAAVRGKLNKRVREKRLDCTS
jgi:copper homeostasis protein